MKTKIKLIVTAALLCLGFASPSDERDHFIAQDLRGKAFVASNWSAVFHDTLPAYWTGYYQGRVDALREAADQIDPP